MFFYLAKGLWFLLQPSTLIALLIGYGAILIWTGWARWGRRFVTIGAILLLLAGLSPLGNVLVLPLENRFPRTNLDSPPPPTGFIILGGAEDRLVGTTRHAPALNEAAERIVEGAILAQRFPNSKIAFTGGDAGILYKSGSEAEGAEALLTAMGVAKDRLILEASARDTYENAVFLKEDLIKQANETIYGLSAGIWTRDITRAHRFAKEIKAGVVWVNTYNMFNAASPFGGYKQSGYGREMGKHALDLYTQVKSVWVDLSGKPIGWFGK